VCKGEEKFETTKRRRNEKPFKTLKSMKVPSKLRAFHSSSCEAADFFKFLKKV
jgi:hypothetical protein